MSPLLSTKCGKNARQQHVCQSEFSKPVRVQPEFGRCQNSKFPAYVSNSRVGSQSCQTRTATQDAQLFLFIFSSSLSLTPPPNSNQSYLTTRRPFTKIQIHKPRLTFILTENIYWKPHHQRVIRNHAQKTTSCLAARRPTPCPDLGWSTPRIMMLLLITRMVSHPRDPDQIFPLLAKVIQPWRE